MRRISSRPHAPDLNGLDESIVPFRALCEHSTEVFRLRWLIRGLSGLPLGVVVRPERGFGLHTPSALPPAALPVARRQLGSDETLRPPRMRAARTCGARAHARPAAVPQPHSPRISVISSSRVTWPRACSRLREITQTQMGWCPSGSIARIHNGESI
jgi:hypothetical protein